MKIGLTGITGRMGREIATSIINDGMVELCSALVRHNSNLNNQDLGEFLGYPKLGGKIFSDIEKFVESCDAVVDFSSPALSIKIAEECSKQRKIMVCGTTGFENSEKEQLVNFAKYCPIVWSANMSIGVNVLMNLIEKASSILREDFDVEIFEMHHRNKVDSPSGTALLLGSAVSKGRNVDLSEVAQMARVGNNNRRKTGEIGFTALRGGDVVGDHQVIFAGDGERIEFVHKASNRNIFAKGAIRAVIWASVKSSGFYSMRDVLN